MAKQYLVTYASYNNWMLPLNLAVGFHLLIAFSLVFLPGMLKPKPKYEDIYTVNLINMAEPALEDPASEPAPPPPPEPAAPEKAVAIAEPETPVAPPKPVKPVSIKPLKRKIKKKVTPPKEDLARQQELERIRRQKLAEALQAEQEAAEQARLAAEMAARQQRLMEQQLAQMKTRTQTARSSRPASSGASTLSILERQYYTAIINRITQFYSLPEFKQWPPDTQAVVVIRINAGGMIVKQFFEQPSQDPTFDQFVRKTLQEAAPLPPIPPALRKSSFEIGLRFSPKNIQ